jgi:ABC transporter substrate binding protein (PQQ-dependent alcohol dehydrogenase system)
MVKGLLTLLCVFLLQTLPVGATETISIGILLPESGAGAATPESPAALGLMGARLAIDDNNTTGRFTKQTFTLTEERLAPGGDPAEAARRLAAKGSVLVVSLLDAAQLLKAADSGVTLFNAASADERLRNEDCRSNVLHTLPDRAMLADGLGQYLIAKHWAKWLLTVGSGQGDAAFAEAIRRTARRFGGRIVAERQWTFDSDSKPATEVPAFTQGPDYDVVVVADEADAFGDLLPYRSWLPRPVAGTQGLVPKAWDAAAEDWGAVQLQNRFQKLARRPMTSIDYAAWVAVRAVGEAATRAKTADAAALRRMLHDPEFSVAGFKGRQLTFRDWDGQLRQPIFLAAASGLVAVAPTEGFMHPTTELDTLGTDRPETKCRMGGAK